MNSFVKTYRTCKELNLDDDTTALMCWNEGYRLGRERWHWGPSWFVRVCGWFNTQISKLKKI